MDLKHRKAFPEFQVAPTYKILRIRAYRMRIDEWSLRKYKSRDDSLEEAEDFKPLPQSSSSIETLPPDVRSTKSLSNGTLESGSNCSNIANPMGSDDVLALIRRPEATNYALEILITKWQVGGQYLDVLATLLRTRRYSDLTTRRTRDGRPQLFKLVEEFVARAEQILVGKLLLEALYFERPVIKSSSMAWLTAWDRACQCNEWYGVKEILYESSTVSIRAGDLFLNSATAVLADQLCRRYIQQFRGTKDQSVLDHSNQNELRTFRQKLMEILEESRDLSIVLQPVLYKRSLEIIENDEYGNRIPYGKKNPQMSLAEWCRSKYLQMTSGSLVSDDESQEDEEQEWMDASRFNNPLTHQNSIVVNPASRQEPEPAVANLQDFKVVATQPRGLSLVTNGALIKDTLPEDGYGSHPIIQALMAKWISLSGFRSYVHSILEGDQNDIFIFDPAPNDHENLFDAIHKHVSIDEELPVAKAVLLACSSINKELCWRPWTLDWWLSIFYTTSWDDLRNKTEAAQLKKHLWRPISSDAEKLLLDATYSLVGERLLNDLKTVMIAIRTSPGYGSSGDKLVRYDELLKQYMAILGTFRERSLNVEPACLAHALNAMG
jgi:hypothetical protein